MKLEPAGAAHAAALAAVHAQSFDAPWDEAAIQAVMNSSGAFGLVVRDPTARAVVGFGLARAIGGEAELLTLAVAPSAQRQGVARTLVTALAGAAQTAGASALFLEVACDNAPALALYKALGFVQVGRRPGYYRRAGGPLDALVFRRDLNSARP